MDRVEISRSPGAPGQYSGAVRAGGIIYLAGMIATDWNADIAAQAKQVFAQIDEALAENGGSKRRLLSVTVFLKTFEDYADFKAAYAEWIDPDNLPARATVGADLLDPKLRIEIQAIAACDAEIGRPTAAGMVEQAKSAAPRIGVEQALGLLGSADALFVDVRDESELQTGKIPGALHIPRGGLEFALDAASDFHRSELAGPKRLILVCGSGGRGALAAQLACALGYDAAYLDGGMKAWNAAAGPSATPG